MECNCSDKFNSAKNRITSKYQMIEILQAFEIIKYYFKSRNNREKTIINILNIKSENYIAYESVYSPVDIPQTNTSIMDGYAINSEIIQPESDVIILQNIFAGISADNTFLTENLKTSCVYITTGSTLPDQFDCVIPVEYAEQLGDNKIRLISEEFKALVRKNNFIRLVGSDISKGELILEKDKSISLSDISTLVSVGIKELVVYKPPKIGVISTGDELLDFKVENQVNGNMVIDTNRLSLINLLRQDYPESEIVDYGIIKDNYLVLCNMFEKVKNDNVDILITSGGVSMGEKDLIKKFIEEKGRILIGRLNMKPGKPMTFGSYDNLSILALPGNPVSCIVCYYLFMGSIIKYFQNFDSEIGPFHPFPTINAKSLEKISLDKERAEYMRGVLYYNQDENTFYVISTGNQRSSRIKSFNQFNCLICLPCLPSQINENDFVKCLVIKKFKHISKDTGKIPIKEISGNDVTKIPETTFHAKIKQSDTSICSVGTITVSDRAYKGEYLKDLSTQAFINYFEDKSNYSIKEQTVVPDEKISIKAAILDYVTKNYNLVLTSGGTGLSPRDVTAEVVKEIIDKELPALSTFITIESMKITKFSCLSNPVVGILNKTLIITLPGNPKAIKENLDLISSLLPHALNQVTSRKDFH